MLPKCNLKQDKGSLRICRHACSGRSVFFPHLCVKSKKITWTPRLVFSLNPFKIARHHLSFKPSARNPAKTAATDARRSPASPQLRDAKHCAAVVSVSISPNTEKFRGFLGFRT